MSDVTQADLRASLEEERARLVEQLTELDEGGGNPLAFDQNFADSSQVTAERAQVEALVAQLRDSLAEVENALSKLDSGTYGVCESCGQTIAPARLEAMPGARLCISCASRR